MEVHVKVQRCNEHYGMLHYKLPVLTTHMKKLSTPFALACSMLGSFEVIVNFLNILRGEVKYAFVVKH